MNIRVATYNPQAASWLPRLKQILAVLSFVHVIALQGTKASPKQHSDSKDTFWVERVAQYDVVHWFSATTELSNKSTGVSLAIDSRKFHIVHRAEIFSPPASLQGRGGAIWYHKVRCSCLFATLYFPTGPAKEKDVCTTALLEWLHSVLIQIPAHTHLYLATDSNARFGLDHAANGQVIFQTPAAVGPQRREFVNTTELNRQDFRKNALKGHPIGPDSQLIE